VNTPGSVTPPVNSVTRATLEAHWGVTKGPGRRWRAPPAGWHTRPQESRDAGRLAVWPAISSCWDHLPLVVTVNYCAVQFTSCSAAWQNT
jgi:hypothetical protein